MDNVQIVFLGLLLFFLHYDMPSGAVVVIKSGLMALLPEITAFVILE